MVKVFIGIGVGVLVGVGVGVFVGVGVEVGVFVGSGVGDGVGVGVEVGQLKETTSPCCVEEESKIQVDVPSGERLIEPVDVGLFKVCPLP